MRAHARTHTDRQTNRQTQFERTIAYCRIQKCFVTSIYLNYNLNI